MLIDLKGCSFAGLLLLCLTMFSGGCRDDEQKPKSFLNSYRILALRAEPAQLTLSAPSTLSLYDFHPDDLSDERPNIQYSWTLCPFSLGSITQYQCFLDEIPIPADELEMMEATLDQERGGSRPLSNAQVTLNPAELFASLGEDLAAQMEQLEMGTSMLGSEMNFFDAGIFEIYVKLTVKIEDEADFEAVKSMVILIDPELAVNAHPEFSNISSSVSLDEQPRLLIEEELELEVNITENSLEEYEALQSESDQSEGINSSTETESVLIHYYSTSGTFDQAVKLSEDTKSTLTIGEDSGPQKLFIVIRDGRGGVDLRAFNFEVEE